MANPNPLVEGGVTLAICCHNSAERLPETLAHLVRQVVLPGTKWEVLLIDNGSTDETVSAAMRLWPSQNPVPLRIIHEPRLGLSYARRRAFEEASYPVVSLIDDDNWVCPDCVQAVADTFRRYPDVALCGGEGVPVFETPPPDWFGPYHRCFALGKPQESGGYITDRFLWGAGLCVRKQVWWELVNCGFKSALTDRQGKALASGGDTELCWIICAAGWKQWYEPRLQYHHFIPAERLKWSYVRRLFRGFGAADAQLLAYEEARRAVGKFSRGYWRKSRAWKTAAALRRILLNVRATSWLGSSRLEGNRSILNMESSIGEIQALWCPLLGFRQTRRAIARTLNKMNERASDHLNRASNIQ